MFAQILMNKLNFAASTLKPFISMSLYKNIHGFDVDATMYESRRVNDIH